MSVSRVKVWCYVHPFIHLDRQQLLLSLERKEAFAEMTDAVFLGGTVLLHDRINAVLSNQSTQWFASSDWGYSWSEAVVFRQGMNVSHFNILRSTVKPTCDSVSDEQMDLRPSARPWACLS